MDTQRSHSSRRRLAAVAVAGAASVAVAVGVGDPAWWRQRHRSARRGCAASGSATASCLQFSEDALALAPIAFDGTVTAIEDEDVTLDVSYWYRGGSGKP